MPDDTTEELNDMEKAAVLLSHLNALHTTDLGVLRIRNNLGLGTNDVVDWCREQVRAEEALITRSGKNWYVTVNSCKITINAHSYTIITAHRIKSGESLLVKIK